MTKLAFHFFIFLIQTFIVKNFVTIFILKNSLNRCLVWFQNGTIITVRTFFRFLIQNLTKLKKLEAIFFFLSPIFFVD
jgi:hypothetical protein